MMPCRRWPDARRAASPTADLIRSLLAAGLYDDALNEIQWAQKTGGDSPVHSGDAGLHVGTEGRSPERHQRDQACVPTVSGGLGRGPAGRGVAGAVPGGYWDLISKNGTANSLDPYLLAALIAQESTFDAEIVSHANAIGLMQIVAKTGRSYARRLHIARTRRRG